MTIPVHQLSFEWFRKHSVWTWADGEDESLVVSVDVNTILPSIYTSLFVKATIKLANGDIFPGAIAIRCHDRAVYSVSLFLEPDEYEFHLLLKDQFQFDLKRLLANLNIPFDQALPLSYTAPYRFDDEATTISGVVRAGNVL